MNPIKQYAAPAFLASALVFNYVCHKAGMPTICGNVRPTLHTETFTGKVVVVGFWSSLTVWILPHLLRKDNQYHVRA